MAFQFPRNIRVLVLIAASLPLQGVHAMPDCTNEEIKLLDGLPDKVAYPSDSWERLFLSYQVHRQCDNGVVAEGYSDAVVHLLSRRWYLLDHLVAISKTHHDFEDFVIRHIDATTNRDDLAKIARMARNHCKADHGLLFGKLVLAAQGALKDL